MPDIELDNTASASIFTLDPAASTPMYLQLRQAVEHGIRSGALKPGQRIPTEVALQKTLGISPITVKGALGPLVKAGLLYRRSRLGTFVAGGAGQKQVRIGVVMSGAMPGDGFQGGILAGLSVSLRKRGYVPEIRISECLEKAPGGDDALVVLGPLRPEEMKAACALEKAPHGRVVFVDVPPGAVKADYVYVANGVGTSRIMERLMERGAKKILYYRMGERDALNDTQRLEAYKSALKNAKLGYERELVLAPRKGVAPSEQMYTALTTVFPDAVFLANGGYFGSLLAAMMRIGRGCAPVYVGGMGLTPGGVPRTVDYVVGPEQLAEAAANRLDKMLKGEKEGPQCVEVTGRLEEVMEEPDKRMIG